MQGLDPENPAMRNYPEQVTLKLQAGDAVAIDYRLLHGTHANAGTSGATLFFFHLHPFAELTG
jgi:ectoine hydroxylase-related dioxygenase (phytanoyl-CoA dioxygenase family)